MKKRHNARPTKFLRELKKIAKKHGYEYAGLNGKTHHSFTKGDIVVSAGCSPKNIDEAIDNFSKDLRRNGNRRSNQFAYPAGILSREVK